MAGKVNTSHPAAPVFDLNARPLIEFSIQVRNGVRRRNADEKGRGSDLRRGPERATFNVSGDRRMYELIVEAEFSAAHRLRAYDGACEKLHGHNWRVEMTVAGDRLNDLGMAMDFQDLKRILNEVVECFDHVFLNDLPEFKTRNPTTENCARVIFERCAERMPEGVRVRDVTVWESPRCRARYSE